MSGIPFQPMKEIRVILHGEQLKFVTDLFDAIKTTGYTIIHNISGKGQYGFHTSHPMFEDLTSLVLVMAAVPEDKVDSFMAGLKPLLEKYTMAIFVSDVSVSINKV